MRQLRDDELVYMIQAAMRGWTPATWRHLQHHDPNERLRMRVACAQMIADKLAHLEMLTDRPPTPEVNYAALSGRSGVPPIGAGLPDGSRG